MDLSDARQEIKDRLTGGVVDFELSDSIIDTHLKRALSLCSHWFEEPDVAQTVSLDNLAEGGYRVKVSQLVRKPHVIRDVLPTRNNRRVSAGIGFPPDVPTEANILGFRSYNELTAGSENIYANIIAIGVNAQMDQVYGGNLTWWQIGEDILIDSSVMPNSSVTIIFSPKPETLEQVTHQTALAWIIDYASALTKYSLGRARSKFEGGDLEFTTDGKDLVNEATTELTTLKEQLQNLDFRTVISR
jgi:hypothetical protein